MTCREKLKIEHPTLVDSDYVGGCDGCPDEYGYLPRPEQCVLSNLTCSHCWDREIPDDEEKTKDDNPHILDSGNRREFGTGAVRDIQEGKGRCDLLPMDVCGEYLDAFFCEKVDQNFFHHIRMFQESGLYSYLYHALRYANPFLNECTMILEVAKQLEEGAKKYGERNWEKGIPVHCYIDSAIRHYLKYARGDKDEPHDRALCWNLMCAIWTCKHHPELNEYASGEEE